MGGLMGGLMGGVMGGLMRGLIEGAGWGEIKTSVQPQLLIGPFTISSPQSLAIWQRGLIEGTATNLLDATGKQVEWLCEELDDCCLTFIVNVQMTKPPTKRWGNKKYTDRRMLHNWIIESQQLTLHPPPHAPYVNPL